MTPAPVPPPRRVIIVVLAIGAAIGAWFMLHTNTSAAARECRSLYHAARTAEDTARVDRTVTAGARRQQDPPSCGFIRSTARWQ